MCVTLAWLIVQTRNRTSSLYIIPLFWTRRVTSIYTSSWTQCLWEWHDLWWRKQQAQSVCFSLIVIHIPKMCSEGEKLKPSENWQGDVSRDLHASAIYLSTSARWGEPQCRRRSPERWSSHIWTWGWQLRSPCLRYLLAYLSKAGKIKLQKKSCVMKQPDGHDDGSRDLQVLDMMMAAEIFRSWTWRWQRRSAGLGHDDGSGDLQVLDMTMAVEICRPWTWWWQRRSAGLGYLSEYLGKMGNSDGRVLRDEAASRTRWWQARSAGLCYLSAYLGKTGRIKLPKEESWVIK